MLLTLQSEFLKTKRTYLLYLCLLGACLVAFFMFFDFDSPERLTKLETDPWNLYYQEGLKGVNILFMPFYIILISTLLPQIEYRNNTWKQVLVSPQPKAYIFLAKFLTVHAFILAFYGMHLLLMAVSLLFKYAYIPSLAIFDHTINWLELLRIHAISYASVLGISAIQFWAGLRFKSFIVPIGIGLAGWISAAILVSELKWKSASAFPYAIPPCVIFPKYAADVPFLLWCSVGFMVLFLGLAYLDFRKMGATE